MPRIPRHDTPGAWFHVMNRAIGRRTLFESEADVRMFLALLARRVRVGQIEIAAFCVLTTHYHLLVCSPRGELGEATGHVQKEYSRWFNRTRRRDGALFRGRFYSKPVDSMAYRRTLVRYIDFNPVSARLAESPALYPHGSARRYASVRGPLWLSRTWIESEVRSAAGRLAYDPGDYVRRFGAQPSQKLHDLVESRIAQRRPNTDPLGDLLGAAEGQALEWMKRKAALADGTGVGSPVCIPEIVIGEIERRRANAPNRRLEFCRKRILAWPQLQVALLRELTGMTWSVIGARSGMSASSCWRLYHRHRQCLADDADYAALVAELTQFAIAASMRDEMARER
jgi:REP element-mobilizing transposase RayT